jgi:hypothetical protein
MAWDERYDALFQGTFAALSFKTENCPREDDCLPPSYAEFKTAWIYISTPPHDIIARCFFKRKNIILLRF